MINMLRKGIKFSIQRVYFPQRYFESRHYGKRFNSIEKFKSLTFQLHAIYFHTFAVDKSVDINFLDTDPNILYSVSVALHRSFHLFSHVHHLSTLPHLDFLKL